MLFIRDVLRHKARRKIIKTICCVCGGTIDFLDEKTKESVRYHGYLDYDVDNMIIDTSGKCGGCS